MKTNPFQFKQFCIHQYKSAMKVGTDGVLLGAWVNSNSPYSVLDIGSGTGLLSLMMKQKFPKAKVTGVEIDHTAYVESNFNISLTSWKNDIQILNTDFIQFAENHQEKFDLIVSNPPFFIDTHKSIDSKRNFARHEDSLPFNHLIKNVRKLLNPKGLFFCIIPTDHNVLLEKIIEKEGLKVSRKCFVKPTPSKEPKRVLLEISKNKNATTIDEEIIIEEFGRHQYSQKYIQLTKDFYLNF